MHGTQKPKAYQGDGNFILISYCSKDANQVYADITELQQRKINVWYDEDLLAGEIWHEEVEKQVQNDKCIGVVFYASQYFLSSTCIWKEVGMTKKMNKEFCVVMLTSQNNISEAGLAQVAECDLCNKMQDLIDEAWRNSKKTEKPMDKETRRMFEDMFDNERVYLGYSDSNRFSRIDNCFRKWNYYSQPEVFPLCNVKHNGHIEYLPSLLALTPFNFTFIVVSLRYKFVANSLNEEGKQPVLWRQYSWGEFRGREPIPAEGGIVVIIWECELAWIGAILEKRRTLAPASPLLINIQIENLSNAENIILDAKSQVKQWEYINKELKTNENELNDFFLVQTEDWSKRPLEPDINKTLCLKGNEPWRVLLSAKEYRDQLLASSSSYSQIIQWLFSQLPLSDDRCFEKERLHLESDSWLKENYDRLQFRMNKYS